MKVESQGISQTGYTIEHEYEGLIILNAVKCSTTICSIKISDSILYTLDAHNMAKCIITIHYMYNIL